MTQLSTRGSSNIEASNLKDPTIEEDNVASAIDEVEVAAFEMTESNAVTLMSSLGCSHGT